MRRWIAVVGFLLLFTMTVQAAEPVRVVINDEELVLPADQQAQIVNDRTLLPMRAIFEALGAEVTWDGETRSVTGRRGATLVRLTIGESVALVNGEPVPLDVPAQLIGDRTYVPVRFVSEALGAEVGWDAATRTVVIQLDPGAVSFYDFAPADWEERPSTYIAPWKPEPAPVWGDPVSLLVPEEGLQVIPGLPLPLRLQGYDETGRLVTVNPDQVELRSPGWEVDPETGDWIVFPDEEGNLPPLTVAWGDGREQTIPLRWFDPGPEVTALLAEVSAVNEEFRAAMAEAMAAQEALIPHEEWMSQYAPEEREELRRNGREQEEVEREAEEIRRRARENRERELVLEACKEKLMDLQDLLAALRAALERVAQAAAELEAAEEALAEVQAAADAAYAEWADVSARLADARNRLKQAELAHQAEIERLVDLAGSDVYLAPAGTGEGHLDPNDPIVQAYAPTPPGLAINWDSESGRSEFHALVTRNSGLLRHLKAERERLQAEVEALEAEAEPIGEAWDAAYEALIQAFGVVYDKQMALDAAWAALEDLLRQLEQLLAELRAMGCPTPDLDGFLADIHQALDDRDPDLAAAILAGAITRAAQAVGGAILDTEDEKEQVQEEREQIREDWERNRRRKRELEREAEEIRRRIREAEEEARRRAEEQAREEERRRIEEAERARQAAARAAANLLRFEKRRLERKLDAIRRLRELQQVGENKRLDDFLAELQEQLDAMDEANLFELMPEEILEQLEEIRGKIDLLRTITDLLRKANNPNLPPVERLRALEQVYGLASGLGENLPGLGAFLTYYGEALNAAAAAMERLEALLGERLLNMGYTCEELRKSRYGTAEQLRACDMKDLIRQIADP